MENNLELDGRVFRSKGDYDAACRDKERIAALAARYRTGEIQGAEALLDDIRSGKVRFATIIGRDFTEELQEAVDTFYIRMAAAGDREDKKDKKNKKKSREQGSGFSGLGKSLLKTDRSGSSGSKKSSIHKSKKTAHKSAHEVMTEFSRYDDDMKDAIARELQRSRKRRRWLTVFCSLVAAGCIGYFSFYYVRSSRSEAAYQEMAELKGSDVLSNYTPLVLMGNAGERRDVPDILDEYKTVFAKNQKLIGWVTVPGTVIDYPVMQTSDNEYYLSHNTSQEEDRNGAIFLDTNCDVLKPSTNFIIYGHNMASGKMFGSLELFASKDYMDQHHIIEFDTIYEKGMYEVMYAFRSKVFNSDEVVFKYYHFIDAGTPAEFDAAMEEMSRLSLYDTGVRASYGDQLLTLSTCNYAEDRNGRFVVVCRKVN